MTPSGNPSSAAARRARKYAWFFLPRYFVPASLLLTWLLMSVLTHNQSEDSSAGAFGGFWGPMLAGTSFAVLTAIGGVQSMRRAHRRSRWSRRSAELRSLIMVIGLVLAYLYYVKVVVGGIPAE